jgi:hypothetical protein
MAIEASTHAVAIDSTNVIVMSAWNATDGMKCAMATTVHA